MSVEEQQHQSSDVSAANVADGSKHLPSRIDEGKLGDHLRSISSPAHVELAISEGTSYGKHPLVKRSDQPWAIVDCNDDTASPVPASAEELTIVEQEARGHSKSKGVLPYVEAGSATKLEISVECPADEKPLGQSSSPATKPAGKSSHGRAPESAVGKAQDPGRKGKEDPSLLPGKIDPVGDMECRVCHANLCIQSDCGDAMELGCACKDDLAVVHRRCAEAWFKIKGNRICEVCGVNAANIVGLKDVEFMNRLQAADPNRLERANPRWWNRMPICNLFISLIIAAILLPWLFHVDLFG
ncbi:hypothetical protein O6H91_10G025500 [Diphasiastrum complanatum]|uniref:Uncharacterized protein n=1 Tax=Diphasiastrum complanatum TaxID=34168 RepID=A0ACC2CFA2_DIPCM|nr:hypothetical protein O6H91_10G025500 [Diphasiastrum complanatum]